MAYKLPPSAGAIAQCLTDGNIITWDIEPKVCTHP
jgi:hypothetical protein